MKLALLKPKLSQKGYAILLAMAFAGISLLLLSSTLSWTASGSKITERNNVYNRAIAAAEAGTEAVIARMELSSSNNDRGRVEFPDYGESGPRRYRRRRKA